MADLDAVNLGLDENEADIAEELQDFDDSFDTRSEASAESSDSAASQPSISSVSTADSSVGGPKSRRSNTTFGNKKNIGINSNVNKRSKTTPVVQAKVAIKRERSSPSVNGGKSGISPIKKKKRTAGTPTKTEVTSKVKTSGGSSSHNLETNSSERQSKSNVAVKVKKRRKKSTTSSNGGGAASALNKSDASNNEEDTDDDNSDNKLTNDIKRNGRKKSRSLSHSPDRRANKLKSTKQSSKEHGKVLTSTSVKSYDYMTKLNYLFRDTRFFLIKSNNADNVALSKSKNVWATLPQNEANLNQAFKDSRNVLLIFSVNESGKFSGFARMSGQSRRDIPQMDWVLPPSISAKALGGVIEIDWICKKELSFTCTGHLYNMWNDGKPVKIGRDGQEIEPKVGAELCRLFPEDENVEMTPILRKSKDTAKVMREKGIRVVYKSPPLRPAMRGRGGYHHGGQMRGKRPYSSGRHYKMGGHIGGMGPPPGTFKRSASPYRNSGGGSGPGGSNSGPGSGDRVPPWERYMTSAAAAEAYVADYMRTMHGQLPPLPFVPPFPGMPMAPAGAGAPASNSMPTMYEQLPPPQRYYDGPPPLPDYPPPQAMRPPPPGGYDKRSPYEDFGSWKGSQLPPMPGMPPGFPGFGLSAINTNGTTGGSSGIPQGGSSALESGNNSNTGNGCGAGGASSYRNREFSNNRARDRGREYHGRGGGTSSNTHASVGSRGGTDRERHFRGGDRNTRNYRDNRR